MAPIFFDYPRNADGLKLVRNALSTFETILQRQGTKYAAGDQLTVADFCLITATICLEGIGMDLAEWPLVSKYYQSFKGDHPDLWSIAEAGLKEIAHFNVHPPDLSQLKHPLHPARK